MKNTLLFTLAIFLLGCTAFSAAEEVKERSEIAAQYKWDLTSMYASTEA